MLKPDFWLWSGARAEIDQRAREARLQLEQLERLLKSRMRRARSLRGEISYGRGLRFFFGGRERGRSARIPTTDMWRPQSYDIPSEACIAASCCP